MKKIGNRILRGLFCLGAAALLEGCSSMLLFDPKGPVGRDERFIIITTILLMLIVVIPVILMVFIFPRKYRASNLNAAYAPKWSHSKKIETVVWLVPAVIVAILGIILWRGTSRLDPYRPIDTGVAPIRVEAVSLDWKWLFIYPDQQIATVNQLVFPANVPLSLRITSDTVMASFFIPRLGSQIYAMAGMQTRLHLLADEPGTYAGQNQQFSGRGYADMTFQAIAVSGEQFETWVRKVRQAPDQLTLHRYDDLKKPGIGYPVESFSSVYPDLFDRIMSRYNKTKGMPAGPMTRQSPSRPMKNSAAEES